MPDRNCNVCADTGRTALGRMCRNGCACHSFDDGTILSARYVEIRAGVWSHRLMRGRKTGSRHADFEPVDHRWYGYDLKPLKVQQ